MRELGARSGVSHSSISLIERDKMSPSVDTLSAILDALGMTFSAFFEDFRSGTHGSIFYEADNFVEIGNPHSISYRMLGVSYPQRQLMVLHERYVQGAHSGAAYCHDAQEAGIVTKGAIELKVGNEVKVLRVGDGYYFDSHIPHSFRNVAKGVSEIISAITPPTY